MPTLLPYSEEYFSLWQKRQQEKEQTQAAAQEKKEYIKHFIYDQAGNLADNSTVFSKMSRERDGIEMGPILRRHSLPAEEQTRDNRHLKFLREELPKLVSLSQQAPKGFQYAEAHCPAHQPSAAPACSL